MPSPWVTAWNYRPPSRLTGTNNLNKTDVPLNCAFSYLCQRLKLMFWQFLKRSNTMLSTILQISIAVACTIQARTRCGFAKLVSSDNEAEFRELRIASGHERSFHLVACMLFRPRIMQSQLVHCHSTCFRNAWNWSCSLMMLPSGPDVRVMADPCSLTQNVTSSRFPRLKNGSMRPTVT